MCSKCGPEPADRRQAGFWRKRYYEEHGSWPKSVAQKQREEAAARDRSANYGSRLSAMGVNPNVSDKLAKEIISWSKNNPDNYGYDNDGNPWNKDDGDDDGGLVGAK